MDNEPENSPLPSDLSGGSTGGNTDAKYIGIADNKLIEAPGRRLIIHRDGMWQLDVPYECKTKDFVSLIPARFSAFPETAYNFCQLDEVSNVEEDGDITSMVATYKGLSQQTSEPTYQRIRNTQPEPLESHLKFVDLTKDEIKYIGDYLQQPKGVVTVYDLSQAGLNLLLRKLRGQTDYLAWGVTWRVSYLSRTPLTEDDESGTGYIAADVPGNPATPSNRTWLYTGAESEREGGVYKINKDYRLSAPGGWDVYIYTQPA